MEGGGERGGEREGKREGRERESLLPFKAVEGRPCRTAAVWVYVLLP